MLARVCAAIVIAAAAVSGDALAQPAGGPEPARDAPGPTPEAPSGAAPAPATTPLPEPSAPAPVEPRFAWQPFGYLRAQYIAVQNDPNVAFVGRDDGFELQNARL